MHFCDSPTTAIKVLRPRGLICRDPHYGLYLSAPSEQPGILAGRAGIQHTAAHLERRGQEIITVMIAVLGKQT